MRNLSYWLSSRLNGNSNNTRRTGSIIAVLGVAFALAVMEITLAVSIGFKKQITYKLQGFIAPVTVYAPHYEDEYATQGIFEVDSALLHTIKSIAPGADPVPSLYMQGMLKTEEDFASVAIKGFENDYPAIFEKENLTQGRWIDADGKHEFVISEHLAQQMGLKLGDKINICYFINGNVKARPFVIVGMYKSGMTEFDKYMTYTSADEIRKIYHAEPGYVSTLDLHGIDLKDVNEVSDELQRAFFNNAAINQTPEKAYNVTNAARQGMKYLSWLDLLDTNVVVIFVLMALVAGCALISSLFIQVLDKVNAVGLLRALGAPSSIISRVFLLISLKLVGWGVILGNILGLGLIYAQSRWHVIALNPDMYYLDFVPVEISCSSILFINLGVVVASWLILILPARIATRLSPASTLRFD